MKWYRASDRLPNKNETVFVAWLSEDGVYTPDCVMTASVRERDDGTYWHDGWGISPIHDTDRWMYPQLPED